MKSRIIFFIAALAVFSSPANAQLFNTVQFYIQSYTNYAASIVRVAPSSTEVVSYHSHGNYNEFYLIDDVSNTTVQRFTLPDEIFVRDFQIVDDMVFFCGAKSNCAVVGHFPISIFHQPLSGQFKYYTLDNCDVDYFKKMVAYYNQNNTKIQLEVIGDFVNSLDIYNSISEFIYDPFNDNIVNSNISYYFGTYSNYHQDGIFQDIAVTEDYLVVSGWKYPNQLFISRFPKYSALSGGTTYNFDESSEPYTSSRISMESLSRNDIATAATYINYNDLSVGIRLRTINVATMSNTVTQLVPLLDKSEPDDLLFIQKDKSLLLLQKSFFPTLSDFQSVIYYLDPYNNSYFTDVYYDFNSSYYSLDRFDDPIYIAAGLTLNFEHGYLMRYKPSNDVSCINKGDVSIKPKNNSPSFLHTTISLNSLLITQHIKSPYSNPELIKEECRD